MFEHLVEAATWKTDKVLDKVLDEVQNSKQFLLSAKCKRLLLEEVILRMMQTCFEVGFLGGFVVSLDV